MSLTDFILISKNSNILTSKASAIFCSCSSLGFIPSKNRSIISIRCSQHRTQLNTQSDNTNIHERIEMAKKEKQAEAEKH